ncbi:hypothetical protein [Flavobacterium litorale]|uniref:Uncharacterized protein n=1 Tax=Flavobacterium litorale TaxID=2856519 RepID=A0ABX8V7P0_9FLAO|nr:hypothetical protein [Flavobacterium litorale]QYJ68869.1 hypothetical protein K1I41_03015 [Flavobacterium litorale]
MMKNINFNKLLLGLVTVSLLAFIITFFIGDFLKIPFKLNQWFLLINLCSYCSIFFFSYIYILYKDIANKTLTLSKWLLYILLVISLIFYILIFADALWGVYGAYAFVAALIHLIVITIFRRYTVIKERASIKREWLAIALVFIIFVIHFIVVRVARSFLN